MQIINCMRDIVEDYKMGRIYIPVEDLEKFGLSVDNFLNKKNRNKLKEVINFQLQRAFKFGEKASLSFSYFDKRNLLAVKTSFDLYCFIGKKILKDPEIIFQRKKIKPGLLFILLTFFKNFFNIYFLGRK